MSKNPEPLAYVTVIAVAVAAPLAGVFGASESWPFGMAMAYGLAAVVVIVCVSMLWVMVEGEPETDDAGPT